MLNGSQLIQENLDFHHFEHDKKLQYGIFNVFEIEDAIISLLNKSREGSFGTS